MWGRLWGGGERGTGADKSLRLMAAASMVAVSLGAFSQPLRAEPPDPPGAAGLPPGVALTSPSTALPPAQLHSFTPIPPGALTRPLPPLTDQAGMGTAAPAPAPANSAAVQAAPAEAAPTQAAPAQAATAPATSSPARAAAPAPRAAPSAVVDAAPVDPLAPVASEVLSLVAKPDAFTSSKKDQEGLSAFYGARQGMPIFVDGKGFNARGKAVLARLAAAGEDGLDPDDYAAPSLAPGANAQALARAELQLATSALVYARQAQSGRFSPSRISSQVTPTRTFPDPKAVLDTLASVPDADAALQAFNPPHAGYKALRAKLAHMTADQAPAPVVSIKSGPLLRPGGSDARVPALRSRLGLAPAAGDVTYGPELVDAVKEFQRSAGLNDEGIVGPATVEALNKEAHTDVTTRADVIANMERWRWLPRDLGAQYVMVNVPEYMARIYDGGKLAFETRIVAGKPQTPTPVLSDDMKYVVVNPAWNIPPSIARNEMMPLLRNNPSALSRRGIEVTRDRGGGYSFRQVPGANNALGRIKFMFPNDHSVYLHDTPSRSLFANSRRAFSHGCMRLQDPFMFGQVIFSIGLPDAGLTKERLTGMLGSKERYLNLKHHIPVHVVYFTTFVNGKGELETREDIYGWNAQVEAQLGLNSPRRVADGSSSRKH